MKTSRGIRNRNPGNIRRSGGHYKGEVVPSGDSEFKQFETMAWGYRAMFVLLDGYARRHGRNTIRTMIERYAPSCENNTRAYISTVAALSGIGCDDVLDTRSMEMMTAVVAAMSRVENGMPADMRQVEEGWRPYVGG